MVRKTPAMTTLCAAAGVAAWATGAFVAPTTFKNTGAAGLPRTTRPEAQAVPGGVPQAAAAAAGSALLTAGGAIALAISAAAVAGKLMRSSTTRYAGSGGTRENRGGGYKYDFLAWNKQKNHFLGEEDTPELRDPTTIPLWQRDKENAYNILRASMFWARKKGEKIYWDCRVLSMAKGGAKIEMMSSGLIAYCPGMWVGTEELQVGGIYKFECMECPTGRVVYGEDKKSVWYTEKRRQEWTAKFSHSSWQNCQRNLAAIGQVKAGSVIQNCIVRKHVPRGLLIDIPLPSPDGEQKYATGLLDRQDISKIEGERCRSAKYVGDEIYSFFPKGTVMPVYVVHQDASNGRITINTSMFEDDDHIGWMMSFPEYCFKNAQKAVDFHHLKRDKWIAKQQSEWEYHPNFKLR
mmetsp:Transcript_76899/g.220159  ORF Transcript_76899/g.220159 Transcript_76899/m.220159 type:complete len:406 (-) Transcript_76899:80-1297(-)|eukprot:CAMPEP_0177187600 /NCGR_PEP_ID=MMETSP0367-20130122/19284_1 /TAXON_ID=447022 ORGANISM="Scrippsiella hangoei-like, Strain SHHI-4" /NCGR_SAMPLE_ID=MMETSP0367 /ASSEMBLY_ACC=CAM_ASM_000362 /LENGTH=405 /DNA_ID=CAMNT_0018635007 /DNA_START=73 /DNA_END=1290 /DNA_ORIENTATION=+